MDKFPEAFKRFERQERIDYRKIRDYNELRQEFSSWALDKWISSTRQNEALRKEAEERGIKETYKIERILFIRRNRIVIALRRTDTYRFIRA
jgi:hypothetical protein